MGLLRQRARIKEGVRNPPLWGACGTLLLVVGALAAGCGKSERPVEPPTVSFSDSFKSDEHFKDGTFPPTTHFKGTSFSRTLTSSAPVAIPENATLEFVPCVMNSDGSPAVIQLEWESQGESQPLGSFNAIPLKARSYARSNYLDLMEHKVRLDLSALGGTRGKFTWTISGGGAGCSGIVGLADLRQKTKEAPPPHVLMICSDTHRYDYSISGEGPALMPRLTKLREESVTYHRAFSSASWTLPSVTSTLTGRYPRFHLTGRRTRIIPRPGDSEQILDREGEFWMHWGKTVKYVSAFPSSGLRTVAGILGEHGYFTAWAVANPFYDISDIEKHGPDVFVSASGSNGSEVNNAAANIIYSAPKDRPVFLLVHYLDVHEYKPWLLKRDHPGETPQTTTGEMLRESYRKAVKISDGYLLGLLDAWKARFGFERSLVIFWSDHGEHLYDPGYPTAAEWARLVSEGKGDKKNPPAMVGHGNSMDEALLHIPLVIRYPDSMSLRGDCHEITALVDIVPTILEVAGIPTDGMALDGESLVGIVDREGRPHSPIHADYQFNGDDMSSVRDGDMKYVVNLDGDDARLGGFLVDTSRPAGPMGEMDQRIDVPDVISRMTSQFTDYVESARKQTSDLKSSAVVNSEEASKSLEDIGYVAP